jgi:pimeloyl-ACP methyl ester carboxylesterase
MKHYILVHGAWEESRAWADVSAVLQQGGHTVTAIDLPGHGRNERSLSEVTMAGYIQSVVDTISALDHKVVLVGHSMTGAVISQVAERIPPKIERLVYVAAFLLKAGATVMEAMESDDANELLPKIVFSDDQTYASVSEQTLRSVGFHDVDESVIKRVLPLMAETQATEPFMAKIEVSDENFGSVPKTYIRTSIDKITSPGLQDTMIGNWNVESVLHLESGHFPAFSVPEKLAELMLSAVADVDSRETPAAIQA